MVYDGKVKITIGFWGKRDILEQIVKKHFKTEIENIKNFRICTSCSCHNLWVGTTGPREHIGYISHDFRDESWGTINIEVRDAQYNDKFIAIAKDLKQYTDVKVFTR